MPERFIWALHRFRWPLLALWLATLTVAGLGALALPDRLSGGGWYVPGSQSEQAAQATRSGFADRGASNVTVVVRDERNTASGPESRQFERRVAAATKEVIGDPRLETTGSYGWSTLSQRSSLSRTEPSRTDFIGKDDRTAVTFVALALDDGTARRVLPEVQQELDDRYAPQGLRVAMVSAGNFWGEINGLSEKGLYKAELLAFPLILAILLLLYRGVMAAVVSCVVAVTAIVLTFGVMSIVASHYELSIFVQNAATMIGIGVGVDYSLFIISRYLDELGRDEPGRDALGRARDRTAALATTLRTSGRTVIFSGLVIIAAMATLFLVDLNVIQSIALGILVVVAFATLASVLVLPLVLVLIGDRIRWGRPPLRRWATDDRGRRWARVARQIMRRPVPFLTVATAALLLLAVPSVELRTFTPDARIVPESSPVRQGFEAMRDQFGPGTASPHQVVITSEVPLTETSGRQQISALQRRLSALPHVTAVNSPFQALESISPGDPLAALGPATYDRMPADVRATVDHYVSADRRTLVLEVIGDDYASADSSRELLTTLRAETSRLDGAGLRAVTGGETAEGVDANAAIRDALPAVVLAMLAVIYLLLLVTLRSLLLPVKAIAINLLSLGATYGVLVLVFQTGLGSALFGVDQFGYLQNFVPILLLAILFSLNTDYELFLLRRIREEYDSGADNASSVAAGMARTAPLISGAALLMVAVFGAFALTGIMPIQQLGLGLALAIAIDATVIRLIVVPAAMQLMGRWNWWLPGQRHTTPRVLERTEKPTAQV
ncbi:MMPL family transporter [Streptomyces gobiensis]|uniref:MMPL family transporter n=1 Tax=Streptomyces gobiensis TaxID=2875706 RepID=UPI001E6194C6|nr:MMPL family transporter [Streptomyces gobiensis]UGY91462.1 MMPL family transporter [Streptomyces gobiensis]